MALTFRILREMRARSSGSRADSARSKWQLCIGLHPISCSLLIRLYTQDVLRIHSIILRIIAQNDVYMSKCLVSSYNMVFNEDDVSKVL